jgi:hypothetical protein
MATSGSYAFDPKVAEVVDEAFERAGIDPATITERHLISARRSLNFMMKEWQTRRIHLWNVEEGIALTPSEGDNEIDLSDGVFDIVEATVVDPSGGDAYETEMYKISREEWRLIPDKTIKGRPDRYWVERLRDKTIMHFWQARGATAYEFRVNQWRYIEDAGAASNNLDVPPEWFEAAAADLAWRLAVKYNEAKVSLLRNLAGPAIKHAIDSNVEDAPVTLSVSFGRGRRAYRRGG